MTLDQKLRLTLGDMLVTQLTLAHQLEEANAKIAELEKPTTEARPKRK